MGRQIKPRALKVQRLSEKGIAVIHRGFALNWTYQEIIDALKKATGETIGIPPLRKYLEHVQLKQRWQRAQAMADVISEATRGALGSQSAQQWEVLLHGAALQHLRKLEQELGALRGTEVLDLYRRQLELALEERRVQVGERRAAADEVKAQAADKAADAQLLVAQAKLRTVEKAARDAADKLQEAEKKAAAGRPLTPAELRDIREQVFGMVDLAEQEAVGE